MDRTRVLIVSVEHLQTFSFWKKRSIKFEMAGWIVKLVWAGLPHDAPHGVTQPLASRQIEIRVKRGVLMLGWPRLQVTCLARLIACVNLWDSLPANTDFYLVDGEAPEVVAVHETNQCIQHDLIGVSAPIFLGADTASVNVTFESGDFLAAPTIGLLLSFRKTPQNRSTLEAVSRYLSSSPSNNLNHLIGAQTGRFVGWPPELQPAVVAGTTRPTLLDLVGWDWRHGVFFSHLECPVIANEGELLGSLRQLIEDGHPGRSAYKSLPFVAANFRRRPLMLSELAEDPAIPAVIHQATSSGAGMEIPDPIFESATSFYEWMSSPATRHDWLPRYWRATIDSRPDLRQEFPDLESADRERFLQWARRRDWVEKIPIAPSISESELIQQWWVKGEQRPAHLVDEDHQKAISLDVSGYLDRRSSLGQIARKIVTLAKSKFDAIHVTLYGRTQSPKSDFGDVLAPSDSPKMKFDVSIQVINADQLGFFIQDHPSDGVAPLRIGYWFWELENAPPKSEDFVNELDEVWTASEFVRASVAKNFGERARLVPVPVGMPEISGRRRSEFGLPSEGFMFLTTFDFYSCSERKNPEGSIRAFLSAFPDSSTSQFLVIKSLHGEQAWPEMLNLKQLAQGRPDIIFLDVSLSDEDQNSLLAEADCLVSLHRSEGFGLHLAQAMYLGTPVIATAYSANLDFMDETSALLVPYTFCNPTSNQTIYAQSSRWADPDLQAAAAHMRLVARDGVARSRLVEAGEQMIRAYDSKARAALFANLDRVVGRKTRYLSEGL